MKYGSLFTGICGFDLGLDLAGMSCQWQVEIDKACRAIEERHYPNIKRWNDVKEVGANNLDPVDLICGGFPCQDLSIAGRRAGLAGERSGLWFEFHRVLAEMRPQWVVVENVPGLLSSNGGRDFAVILRGLVELGYGVAWRVLDAQYFGVAQRRRRVFVVGHLGDGRAAEVLFEREGGAWDTPPSREKGQGIAADVVGSLAASGRGTERTRESRGQDPLIAMALNAHPGKRYDAESETMIAIRPAQTGSNGWGILEDGTIHTLDSTGGDFVSWHENKGGSFSTDETARALRSNASHSYQGVGVRRLTPTECERLQGFPDGWTAGQADGPRYRQLGNAVCVPVIEWIGKRIMEVR